MSRSPRPSSPIRGASSRGRVQRSLRHAGPQDLGIHVHQWRGEHRGMAPVQLRRRRELGIATVRLRKIVAEWR